MIRTLFKSKIHRATVTQADLHYEGSITIDADLLDAADLVEHEKVAVWNVTRGSRIETYTLAGGRSTGVICVNGAAAHHFEPGDLVIIASWAQVDEADVPDWKPTVVLVDGDNKIVDPNLVEVPGPALREGVARSAK